MQDMKKLIAALSAGEAAMNAALAHITSMKTIVLRDLANHETRQQLEQQQPLVSYHEASSYLRSNGTTFALVYELNFKQLQQGCPVPEVSEALMQMHRREHIAVPDEVLRYIRKSLPELKKMARMTRLKWTLGSERRAVDVVAGSANVWAAAHTLTCETGRLVTAGSLRGRVKTIIPKRALSTLRRQFSPQQVAYLTRHRRRA